MGFAVKQKSRALKLAILILAAVIMSVNINTFISAGELIPGGFTGITLFIQRVAMNFFNIAIPFTLINFALNAVPAFICYKKIGKRFTVYSCLVVVLQSILTDILPHYSLTNDILLICVFGGLINGFCISLCLIAGATSGGSDFLSLLMAKKGITNSWYYIFMGNVILIIMSGFTFGWDKALYSIIFQFTSTQVINTMHLRYKRDTLFIITDFPSPVYEVIKDITNHAGTIFQGTGCYMKKTKNLVYSVVASDEVKDVIREVKKIDKDAFINIVKTDQVIGKFYQRPEE